MSIIGTQFGADAFIAKIVDNGSISIADFNNPGSYFQYQNVSITPAFFTGNKIVYPRGTPMSSVALIKTSTAQNTISYGISYLSFYFYMKTDQISEGSDELGYGEYDKIFIDSNGYIADLELQHSKEDSAGGKIWPGVWQFESADIKNIKGNLSQIDMTVSKQVVAEQILDPSGFRS